MSRFITAAAITAALLAGPAAAAEPEQGARLGITLDEISAALAADGYALTAFERSDRSIELTIIREARRIEAFVDPSTGEVTRVETRGRGGPWPLPGVDDADLRARLSAEGYEIVKYERERGEIEVKAMRDGRRWELEIDPRDGRTLKVEEDE
ncbi:PepSY domain-containing protein [Limibaculum sp. M0105]|uniref:PepSY domain-containing protein n=1 Tax=Thermohalobaculum xanthum TaxID=2753746 RepID=A0A8J7M530_9RHOB|nr:PepSY domain-containing protein [Thermohalobaculum xanthum]MBK0398481.1 PepSY domain-containing protein [Thermohalobaculum xanthum]